MRDCNENLDDGFWDCNTIIKCVVGVESRELAYKISLQLSVDGGPRRGPTFILDYWLLRN